MAVPSTFADLSTTPGSNTGLIDDSSAVNTYDDHCRTLYAFVASISGNTGNGWTSPYLTVASPSYTGTLTGGTGAVNLGSGQFIKDSSGNVGIGRTPGQPLDVAGNIRTVGGGFVISAAGYTSAISNDASGMYAEAQGAQSFRVLTNGVDRFLIDSAGNIRVSLPTSNPALSGALWNDGGTVKISAG